MKSDHLFLIIFLFEISGEFLNVIVHRQNQKTCRSTKYRAGDTMVTTPAAIVILDVKQSAAGFFIP